MSNAVLAWSNLLIGAELAASAETDDGRVGNIVKPQVVTAWRALAASAWFAADLGAAQPMRVLMLLGVTLSPAATLRVRLSTSDAHAGDVYDSGIVAAGAATGFDGRKQCLRVFPAAQTAHYVKVDLADGGAAFIDVGYAWIGDWWQPARNFSWGFQDGVQTETVREISKGGQVYALRRPKARVKRFALDFATPTEAKTQMRQIDDRVGDHAPFLMIPDPDAADAASEAIIGTMTDLQPVTGRALNVRSRPFEMVELL
jgi:hypothetical protein